MKLTLFLEIIGRYFDVYYKNFYVIMECIFGNYWKIFYVIKKIIVCPCKKKIPVLYSIWTKK